MSTDRHRTQKQAQIFASRNASGSAPLRVPARAALLKIKDVADIVGVVPKTVRAWIKSEKLKAVRDGRIIRITPAALDDYISKHMQ